MRVLIVLALLTVSGCSWFHSKAAVPAPTEFVITGAPVNSVVFVDGTPSGEPNSANGHPQVIDVSPGPHTIEIYIGATVIYREDSDALPRRKTLIRVLSGPNR